MRVAVLSNGEKSERGSGEVVKTEEGRMGTTS
jgi:hypothetical protein